MNAAFMRRAIAIVLVLIIASLGALGYAFYTLAKATVNYEKACRKGLLTRLAAWPQSFAPGL